MPRSLLGLILAAVTALATPAFAQLSSQPTWAVLPAANRSLAASVEDAARAGRNPPMLATSPSQLRAAFNLDAIAEAPSDPDQIFSLCEAAADGMRAYRMFGGAETPQNYIRFQDEIGLGMRFQLRCMARVLPMVTEALTSLAPDAPQRAGISLIQRGAVNTYRGAALSQLDATSAANRQALLDEAVRDAEVYATAMSLAGRRTVIGAIDQVLASRSPRLSNRAREQLRRLRAVMARTDCTGFCAA